MRSTGGPEETQAQRIEAILAGGEEWEEALEDFVASAVYETGHRSGWRWTDGIDAVTVVQRSERRVRLIARVWEVSQEQTHFWLDLEASVGTPVWTLYFDIAPDRSERFRRNAVHLVAAPEDVAWGAVIHSAG